MPSQNPQPRTDKQFLPIYPYPSNCPTPRPINNQFMQNRKPTKKAAAVKRKPIAPKSQNVADLRNTITNAIGALVALDLLIDRMIKDKQ